MKEIRRVVIAGGGTAGWMAAAALSQQFHGILDISLVESEEIGTVGVGESTIPPIRTFHRLLGINEQDFMRATAATFKLGILFDNWGQIGERYIHPFGATGKSTWAVNFHHFWLHSLARGMPSEYGEFCLEHQAAKAGKFFTGPNSETSYAYHLDASVYAKFLRKFTEKFGVRRIEGKIKEIRQHAETGFIESLVLDSGQVVEGDLFIDCTGFRGLLIEQTLKTGYEDWNHWLPCDSAVAVQTESTGPAVPYTRAIAHEAGWRWRIPLQHRVGNGLVYCSRYMSDQEATDKLMREVEGRTLVQPRVIKFRTGRRRNAWNKNVIAVGLANGFVEPLESTSIHLIMTSMTRLIYLFPFPNVTQAIIDQYNDESRLEAERVRDFIILHYCATRRDDSPLWKYCSTMSLPEPLQRRIDLFRERAHVWQPEGELFRTDSWVHVMLYQGIRPEHYHYLATAMPDKDLATFLANTRATINQAVEQMPTHQDFVDRYARANDDIWNRPAM
ncbi:MAG TPA: tryptophan halogenase family protein [Steroidobacteraceae bacterium]|nr:tryptophan halogenase family protein [Steroidobacteraceae bacterium]